MAQELTTAEPLATLARHGPLGLFSDIDGTLAPIVAVPGDARVTQRCRQLLADLRDAGVRVALVTGRPLEMAQRMTNVDGVVYAANHGMSIWIDGRDETSEEVRRYGSLAQSAYGEIIATPVPGTHVEVTGPNVALHYRQADDAEAARDGLLAVVAASPSAWRFRVREGRKVIELRPPLEIDKGTAVLALAARLEVRSILCLGDDQTDVDMFRVVESLRGGGVTAMTVAVRSNEAPDDVLGSADYWVDGVPGVEWVLAELVTVVSAGAP